MINRARRYLPWNGVEEKETQTSDREILNVFRYADESMLATKEIADELPITREWTHKRLKRLKEDGRLEFRKFAGEGGTQETGGIDVWRLSESETAIPVPSGPIDIGWWIFQTQHFARFIYRIVGMLLMVGGLLLIPIFFLFSSEEMNSFILHQSDYAAAAMAAALTAGLFFIVGGAATLLAVGMRKYFLSND